MYAIHERLHITQAIQEKLKNSCYSRGNTHFTSYSGKGGERMLFMRDYTLHKLLNKSRRILAIHEGLHNIQAIQEKLKNSCYSRGTTQYTSYSGKGGERMLFIMQAI
jgi:hypothetical protein